MAWFGLDKLLLGVDLTAQQQQENQYAADTAAWQQQQLATGKWSQAQYDQAQQNLQSQEAQNANVVGQVDQQFVSGLGDGLNNVLEAPGKAVGAVGNAAGKLGWGVLSNIPWWAWVGGLVVLFFWMGGAALLKGRLKAYA